MSETTQTLTPRMTIICPKDMIQDAERAETAARIARIRKLCDDLDKTIKGSEAHRALLVELKNEADEANGMLFKSAKKFI